MPNLFTASTYKDAIINVLLKNKDLVALVNPKKNDNPKISIQDVLLGGSWIINGKKYKEQGHIFDYNFVDDTIEEEKTFIFVETDIDSVYQELFVDFNLFVCVFTAKELVRITDDTIPSINDVEEMGYNVGHYGNRIDILCDVIDRTLIGNMSIKGISSVEPAPRGYVTIYCPNSKYYGKCLKYHIKNTNDSEENCE